MSSFHSKHTRVQSQGRPQTRSGCNAHGIARPARPAFSGKAPGPVRLAHNNQADRAGRLPESIFMAGQDAYARLGRRFESNAAHQNTL
jgi:hypothetical protein